MILQLKNVESAYGLSQILFGVNLEVREGEVCCLLGPQRRRQIDDNQDDYGTGEAQERRDFV